MKRYHDNFATLYAGDCVEVMAALPEASVDAIVTDPPYGLEFMGKEWDRLDNKAHMRLRRADELDDPIKAKYLRHSVEYVGGAGAQAWHEQWARAALRVLKPGGHLLAFGGSRTYHRLACAIEDAGFEVRDCLMYLYGTGFPKSLDVSKAIDKAARGVPQGGPDPTSANHGKFKGGCSEENKAGRGFGAGPGQFMKEQGEKVKREIVEEARRWSGWGTALKPAHEPIILARKPLAEKNVAANVLKHGTGAINVDGCRIKFASEEDKAAAAAAAAAQRAGRDQNANRYAYGRFENGPASIEPYISGLYRGRWPANVLLDEEAARLLDEQSGESESAAVARPSDRRGGVSTNFAMSQGGTTAYGDRGGASRFFYTAKADREDRDGSKHPTVKPVSVMKWLIRLVTPPEGVVLDPFLGSGTTVYAARSLGIKSIGIEREPAYLEDAVRRLRQGQLL